MGDKADPNPSGFVPFYPPQTRRGSAAHLIELLEDGVDCVTVADRFRWFLALEEWLASR